MASHTTTADRRTRKLALVALGATLLGMSACAEGGILPTETTRSSGTRHELAPTPSLAAASIAAGATLYDFDDLTDLCSFDNVFPDYRGLIVSGFRAIAVCEDGILFFAASTSSGPETIHFALPGAASEATIQMDGYNTHGERVFRAYDDAGAIVDEVIVPAGERRPFHTLALAGDIRSVSITDYVDNSRWDDLVVVYAGAPSDASPPEVGYAISPAVPDGLDGWYRTDVALTWSVTEAESPGSVVTIGCVDQSIAADQAPATYPCSATSDGGAAPATSVTIKRDATPPSVVYAGNRETYTIDQKVEIGCSASDATSGVTAVCEGLDVPAYRLEAGETILTAEAEDRAGNRGVGSASFTVSTTYGSLCAVIQQVVTVAAVGKGLCVELMAIERLLSRGEDRYKPGLMRGLQRQIERAAGRWFSQADAAMLTRWVQTL